MDQSFKQMCEDLLSFVESDAQWWNEAAQRCEDLVNKLGEDLGAEWNLHCAVYRERAKTHLQLVEKMRANSSEGI